MKDVAGHGRTILFVSHNMAAIQSLCSVCVLLENGKISLKETPRLVARKYFSNSEGASFKSNKNLFNIAGLTSVYISDATGRKIHSPITSDEFHFVIEWKCEKVMPNLKVGIGINSEDGTRIVGSIPEDSSIQTPIGKGNFRALVAISKNTLLAQKYQIDVELWVKGGESLDFLQPALVFEVQPGESMILLNDPERKGFLQFLPKWSFYNYE
jgi:lipopolysaccharide transport system ATP-binding protein